MSACTIESIIDDLGKERFDKKNVVEMKNHKKNLKAVWASYNAWILSQMLKRKGSDSPNFANITWEILAQASSSSSTPLSSSSSPRSSPRSMPMPPKNSAYQIRLRPSFTLSPTFKRLNNLTLKSDKFKQPPTLTPSEMINFHKLALRFSSNLTKDVIFTGFRDIIRRIGEVVGLGKHVKLVFSFGVAVWKDRKCSFVFDVDVLKVEGGNGKGVSGVEDIVFFVPKEEERKEEAKAKEGTSTNEEPETAQVSSNEASRLSSPSSSSSSPHSPIINSSSSTQAAFTSPTRSTASAVQEESFSRYLSLLESSAQLEASLNSSIKTLQSNRDQVEESKVIRKREKNKLFQGYICEQIERRKEVKAKEVVGRKEYGATSFYPVLSLDNDSDDGDKGDDDDDGNKEDSDESKPEDNTDTSTDTTTHPSASASAFRKYTGIPGVPKKGMGFRISSSELLSDLTTQMSYKQETMRNEKAKRLEEERRFIEHVSLEMDYDVASKSLEKVKKREVLLEAWERERYLKTMDRLRGNGDIEGMVKHKNSLLVSMNGNGVVKTLPPLKLSKSKSSNQMDSGRSGRGASVGFDSRR